MNLKKLARELRVNLLRPGPRLIKKKNLPARGLTKVEKHWFTVPFSIFIRKTQVFIYLVFQYNFISLLHVLSGKAALTWFR